MVTMFYIIPDTLLKVSLNTNKTGRLRNVGLISCFEFLLVCFVQKNNEGGWLELLCLTPLSTIFELYRGGDVFLPVVPP
jgi:hypothetical protein